MLIIQIALGIILALVILSVLASIIAHGEKIMTIFGAAVLIIGGYFIVREFGWMPIIYIVAAFTVFGVTPAFIQLEISARRKRAELSEIDRQLAEPDQRDSGYDVPALERWDMEKQRDQLIARREKLRWDSL